MSEAGGRSEDLGGAWGSQKEQLNYQSIITSSGNSKGVPKIYIDTWEPTNAITTIYSPYDVLSRGKY